MRKSGCVTHRMRSATEQACLLETLEVRQFLSATLPNIMPLGDSITSGFTGHASYRYWLWNSLADAGYTANFVGTGAGTADGPGLFPGFDSDHEGHSGFRADDIQALVEDPGWKSFVAVAQNKPDIVLLHIGSNDLEQGQPNSGTRNQIGAIIDDLRVVNPNVTILLAQIIPEANVSVAGLNGLLPALATAKNTAQSRVILVDQATGFDTSTQTYDGVHPNESGEKQMAARWLAALTPLLPAPTPQPEGTYLDTPAVPLTNAINPIGPVEYESSNGDADQYDGHMLTLRGKTYMRGFGVHANSELDFNMSGGNYSRFRATVGLDDEVNGLGSVSFQVFVNNEATPRFSSPTLTGADAALPIDVDISGATSLRLVVNDSGNDNDFDHADWVQARLITAPVQPPPPPSGDVPSAPKKLHAKYHGHRVDLCWKDTSSNELGFRIERKTGANGVWQQIAQLGANTRAYRDTQIVAGAHYYYRVTSYNADGASNPSNVDGETVPPRGKKGKNCNLPQARQNAAKVLEKLKSVIQRILKIGGED